MLTPRPHYVLFLALLGATCKQAAPAPPTPAPGVERRFTNPLRSGSDPWVVQDGATYYYTQTTGSNVTLWRTTAMSQLAGAPRTMVFTPPASGPNSRNVWAPELHRLGSNGGDLRWYVYYTAGNGVDSTQRLWVLENDSADPTTGTWTDRGRVQVPGPDRWAIDATVLTYQGANYLLWSGRPVATVQTQNLYIARLANPWTLDGPPVLISTPELAWERNGGPVNEGPQALLSPNGQALVVYSASGCWTDDYALGLLQLRAGGNPLTPADWTKLPQPVFTKNPSGGAYGPGHNAFFRSPDGQQHWIIYHANSNPGEGCGERRNIRIQPFTFRADGLPFFGEPAAVGAQLPVPAGEQP